MFVHTRIWVANRHLVEFDLQILHAFEYYDPQTQSTPRSGVGNPQKISQPISTPPKIVPAK